MYGITGAVPTSLLPASWNIAPTKDIYIVREDQQAHARELGTASWGLIGTWHKDLATARRRRCLVPADGYYEWATVLGPYRPKQPFTARCRIPKDRWESWMDSSLTDADDLRKLMEYSDLYVGLSVYAVSNTVNSAAHDGPELIKPITLGEPQTLF